MDFADARIDEDLEGILERNAPRLIVGKKGVGKTVYLRNLRANTHEDRSVYADEVRHDVPVTEDVIKVCEMYPPDLAPRLELSSVAPSCARSPRTSSASCAPRTPQ